MNENTQLTSAPAKSSLVAGVLAIVLGAFGVHDWYLDDQKKAKKHVLLAIIWVILLVISTIFRTFAPSTGNLSLANTFNSIATTARVLSWIVILADVLWGIIDSVILLTQGDAGLAARGFVISAADQPQSQPQSPNQPSPQPAPSATHVTLPPAPTLAERALNPNAPPEPIVFNSANIQQSASVSSLSQPLATRNVPAPALTVQNHEGNTTINPIILHHILITAAIVVAVAVIAVVVKNGISSTLAAGYGSTYRAAKELSPKITSATSSSSCEYAVTYVKSATVNKSTYDGYVNNCKSLAVGLSPLVEQLGQTPAISWDSKLTNAYQTFRDAYLEAFPGEEQSAAASVTLDLYQTWHDYLLAADLLSVDSPDSEFQQAADILRTSGNDTLAKYGEEWLTKELDYLATYRAYWDLSYTDPAKDSLRTEVETKREDLRNWVDDHRPDVTKLASFPIPSMATVKSSFTELYDLIKSAYESHYDVNSGDCNQAGNAVYCS